MSDDYTRRSFLEAGGTAAVLLTSWNPLSRDGAGKLSELALASDPGVHVPPHDSEPKWIVRLDSEIDEAFSSLRTSWADGEEKQVLRELPGIDAAVVRAPRDKVGARTGWTSRAGGGLAGRDYVESIDLNISMDLAEPVKRSPLTDEDGVGLSHSPARRVSIALDASSAIQDGEMPTTEGSDPPLATGEQTQQRAVGDAHETQDAATLSQAAGASVDTSTLRIGVIDTGCNVDGNAISESRIVDSSTNYVDSAEPTVGSDGIATIEDGNYHGTWVASCIAANPSTVPSDAVGNQVSDYRGPLANAELWIAKALDDEGSGSTDDIAAAIEGAIGAGCDWVCMSLGSPTDSKALEDAIEKAVENGTGIVVAAGNDRYATTWVATPASDDAAIGVHATTAAPDDPESVLPAYFANTGPHNGVTDLSDGASSGAQPDFASPGMDLEAIVPRENGASGLETMSGTSMAAPTVVAVAGLVEAGTDLTDPGEIRTRLRNTAYRPPDVADVEGHGLPSAQRAISEEMTDEMQTDAMNGDAASRAAYYNSWSVWQGRLAFNYL